MYKMRAVTAAVEATSSRLRNGMSASSQSIPPEMAMKRVNMASHIVVRARFQAVESPLTKIPKFIETISSPTSAHTGSTKRSESIYVLLRLASLSST